MTNKREDRYGISWWDGNGYHYQSKGYWDKPIIDKNGQMCGGTWVSYEDERKDDLLECLQRIEDKLDLLLASGKPVAPSINPH